MSVLDTLRAATPQRTTVTVILDGALQAEWDALNDQLPLAAAEDAKRSMADIPATTKIVEALDTIRDRVAASEVTFHLERIDWTLRVAMQGAHPPRPGNTLDRLNGYNVETFTPALIRASTTKIVGVDGDAATDIPDDVWDNLLGRPEQPGIDATDDEPAVPAQPKVPGSLNYKAVNDLTRAANAVNDNGAAVPPSARFLLGSQDSGASLAQPSPGTSPRADSEAGSPSTSPRSSATKKTTPRRARSAAT